MSGSRTPDDDGSIYTATESQIQEILEFVIDRIDGQILDNYLLWADGEFRWTKGNRYAIEGWKY